MKKPEWGTINKNASRDQNQIRYLPIEEYDAG